MTTVTHTSTGLGTEVTTTVWDETHTIADMSLGYSKTMFYKHAGEDYVPGDTAYHAIDETEAKVANNHYLPSYARIVARVNADEAGAKYLKITDGAADVAEVTWSGAAAATIASAWTAYTDTTDRTMKVEYKASSATETVTLINVALEMR